MLFFVNDSAPMGAVAIQVSTQKFYNWATAAWETPFSAANHVRPIVPLMTSPSAFATVQDCDVSALVGQKGVLLVAVTLDSAGNPISAVDYGTVPGNQGSGQGVFV